jgi:hypothetical protein
MISEQHPEFLALTAAIFSTVGRTLAVAAALEGLPPLCGVDPMLREIIVGYRDANPESLKSAGFIVARLMRDELKYTEGKNCVMCPAGCTAKTGTLWLRPADH